jgi:glutamate-1-semialdehyde 2,1-aminomutase
VEKCFDESRDGVACVIIEPIAGNMGLVPADEEFLEGLRELCDSKGALLIFDEVMSGFRASLKGAQGLTNVIPDLVTLGKVIGGGMPVGAFGGRADIMGELSPEGPIYQAGTLSGNPVAMAAGLAGLRKLRKDPSLYVVLAERARRLTEGFMAAAAAEELPMVTEVRGSMFGFFFTEAPVRNFADAKKGDNEFFRLFHRRMLESGIYLACSSYETGFVSAAITDEMIDETVRAAYEAMRYVSDRL